MAKKIILVEDNIADAELIRIVVAELGFVNAVIPTNGHDELFQYLDNNPVNDIGLILLDLNMPRINGIEILKKIRSSQRLQYLPVVIFTTSSNKNDIMNCYDLGANAYVCKPIDYDTFNHIIQSTVRFWTECNLLPSN
jgi:two-component system, response regulator